MLYSLAIPFGYITGVFRLMSAKPLVKYVAFGFALDIIFTITLLFLQGVNNAMLTSSS
jgi:hypothetical protein